MVVFAGRGAVGTLGAVGRQPVCHRRRPESRCSSFLLFFFFFAFLSFPSGLFSPLQGHGASLFYKERIFLAGISRLIWKYFFLFIICIFSSPHQHSLCVWNVYWNLSYSIAVYYSKNFSFTSESNCLLLQHLRLLLLPWLVRGHHATVCPAE